MSEQFTVPRVWVVGDVTRTFKYQKRTTIQQRFWAKVKGGDYGADDCWLWTGSTKTTHGYGEMNVRVAPGISHTFTAQRLSWLLSRGYLRQDRFICHTCDNRACVNPAHLFEGTQLDNLRDMVNKERSCALLTHEQARDIRERYKRGSISQRALALEYGVAQTTISKILTGKSYRISEKPRN